MKLKFIFAPLIILGSLNAQAQFRTHLQAGMTISTFDTDLMEAYEFDVFREQYILDGGSTSSGITNSVRPGAFVSIELDLQLNEKAFIKSGVKYTNAGDSYFFKTTDIRYRGSFGINTDGRFITRPRIDYIAIPANYGLKFDDFTVYGGATIYMLWNNYIRSNRFELNNNFQIQERWDRQNNGVTASNTLMLLNVGANYLFYGWDVETIVSLNIGYTLNPVYNDPLAADVFTNARLWNIELGYGISLGNGD